MQSKEPAAGRKMRIADTIQQNIESLSALEAGWNGPNSLPVNRDSLAKLLGLLSMTTEAVPDLTPALVPLSSGGVQAEWHNAEKSVEVGVDSDGQTFAFATEGEVYHVDVEPTDVLPDESVQALRDFLPQLRPSETI